MSRYFPRRQTAQGIFVSRYFPRRQTVAVLLADDLEYDCFMVWTPHGFNRIQAWFARLIAANGRLPSDHRAANHPIASEPAAVLTSVKDKPSAELKKHHP